jgi:hypothetical protein
MAVFELDPARWVPHGHQIEDGGPTRLPRTFYTPSEDPPQRYGNYVVAILEPAPPQAEEGVWRDLVREFIQNHHHRAVVSSQATLFVLGLFQLRSTAAAAALLIQPPFEITHDIFVRFVPHNDRINHRSAHGFCIGWLMFLGIPLDYRNTFDIANVVATFGTYHNWHRDDEILDRTLVFASYPSTATVPRDVVFGRYANLGAARESWTAPCYVLNDAFADIMAPDEDRMPFDGNPHPLPGQLLPKNNLLVMPHYPELGWQVDPNVQQNDGQAGLFAKEVQDNMQDVVEEMVMDSIVLNPSSASTNQQFDGEVNQLAHVVQQPLQIGVVRTFFGPELPPALLWERNFKQSTFSLFYADIQKLVFQFSISYALSRSDGKGFPS